MKTLDHLLTASLQRGQLQCCHPVGWKPLLRAQAEQGTIRLRWARVILLMRLAEPLLQRKEHIWMALVSHASCSLVRVVATKGKHAGIVTCPTSRKPVQQQEEFESIHATASRKESWRSSALRWTGMECMSVCRKKRVGIRSGAS